MFDAKFAGDFLYGHNGPCPQIARDHPFGQVPEILDIPEQETIDWDNLVNWIQDKFS